MEVNGSTLPFSKKQKVATSRQKPSNAPCTAEKMEHRIIAAKTTRSGMWMMRATLAQQHPNCPKFLLFWLACRCLTLFYSRQTLISNPNYFFLPKYLCLRKAVSNAAGYWDVGCVRLQDALSVTDFSFIEKPEDYPVSCYHQ